MTQLQIVVLKSKLRHLSPPRGRWGRACDRLRGVTAAFLALHFCSAGLPAFPWVAMAPAIRLRIALQAAEART